jgi:hypothetical protein
MNKTILFGLILFMAVIAIVTFFKIKDNRTELEKAWHRQPVEQIETERFWKEVTFEKIAVVEEGLQRPLSVRPYKDHSFLLSDFGDMIVKKYGYDGELMAHFGKGEGRGPGEMLGLMDIQVDSDNQIWVLDPANSRITVFDSPNQWIILDVEKPLSRAIPLNSNHYLVKLRFSDNPEKWNRAGQKVMKYEPLVKDPLLWSYIHDGFLEKDLSGGVVRNFLYFHGFIRYNSEGEIDYFRRAIGPPTMEEIMDDIDEPRRYSEDQEVFFREMSPFSRLPWFSNIQVYGNDIHALLSFATDEVQMSLPEGDIYARERRFVDVYNLTSGDYRYSYKLPEPVIDIAISGEYVAGITSDVPGVVIWRVEPGSW